VGLNFFHQIFLVVVAGVVGCALEGRAIGLVPV